MLNPTLNKQPGRLSSPPQREELDACLCQCNISLHIESVSDS